MASAIGLVATAVATRTWPDATGMAVIGTAASLAWTAFFAKDKAVTGGTVSNVDGSVAPATSLIVGGRDVKRP